MNGDVLAHLNAVLNATSAVLVACGIAAVRAGRLERHRRFMTAAFWTSTAFLASYLTRFALTGAHRFPEVGWVRVLYLGILLGHTLLAIALLPMVLRTIWLARRGRFVQHRRIARWTWPVWVTVGCSGVVVYVMLYHLAPALLS